MITSPRLLNSSLFSFNWITAVAEQGFGRAALHPSALWCYGIAAGTPQLHVGGYLNERTRLCKPKQCHVGNVCTKKPSISGLFLIGDAYGISKYEVWFERQKNVLSKEKIILGFARWSW